MTTIYRKTVRGHAEIETRTLHLSPRLRTALIMVDGRRTDEELRLMILGQPDQTLQALTEQGLIEAIAITVSGSSHGGDAPAAPAAPKPGVEFQTLRREAVRALNEALGPDAESLAMRMERAARFDELRPLLELAITVIGNARGGGAATKFATRFLEAVA